MSPVEFPARNHPQQATAARSTTEAPPPNCSAGSTPDTTSLSMWHMRQSCEKFVRPDDKVLRDDSGAAIPVRSIEHIFASDGKVWVGFTDGTANVVFDAGDEVESGEQRDRIIWQIWASDMRIVCADPNDPENL